MPTDWEQEGEVEGSESGREKERGGKERGERGTVGGKQEEVRGVEYAHRREGQQGRGE